jgi:hypothetical protein
VGFRGTIDLDFSWNLKLIWETAKISSKCRLTKPVNTSIIFYLRDYAKSAVFFFQVVLDKGPPGVGPASNRFIWRAKSHLG